MAISEGAHVSKKSILIADDDPVLLEMLSDKLERGGFQVYCALDGETAHSIIWQHYPDVVILDWLMPEPDGLTLCRMIKANAELVGTKVVVLTARGRKQEVATVLAANPDLLLIKPVSLRSLLDHVKELSGTSQGAENA